MRKALCALFAAAFALSSLTGTASAKPQDVSAQVLTCPSGTLCVWPVPDGSTNRCSWVDDNPNWGAWCSWSSSRPVRAAYNTKPSYPGVCLYTGTSYRGTAYFIGRGQVVTGPGVIVRSHRWTTSTC